MSVSDAVLFLESMRHDMENDVCNNTRDGKCIQCGSCCSNILWLSHREKETIRKYIKRHHVKQCKHLVPTTARSFDYACPFLDTDKLSEKCRIYEVRPEICRDFICSKEQRDLKVKEDASKLLGEKYEIVFMREEFFG